MPYEPDIDKILDEDEDIKIWRGSVEEEFDAENRDRAPRARRDPESSTRRSRRTQAESEEKKRPLPKLNINISFLKYIDRRNALICLGALVLLIAAGLLPFDGWKKTLVYLLPFAAAGFGFAIETVHNILNIKMLERVNVLFVAAVLLFCVGEYVPAVLIFVLFTVYREAERFALARRKEVLMRIRGLSAERTRVETPDGAQLIGPEYVEIGDIIEVRPGERVSHDGIVKAGISTLDLSPLTGTTDSLAVNVGHRVCAGSINVTSTLRIEVTENYEDSTSFKVAELVEDAERHKSDFVKRTNKIFGYFTPVLFACAIICAVLMPILVNGEWSVWLKRAAILLIISGTAGVGASMSLACFGSLSSAAKRGVIVKGGDYMAKLAKAETVVFDKTGVITEGEYKIKEVFPVNISEEQLLSIAATAESNSDHAIARAIKQAGEMLKVDVLTAEEIPGKGVSAFINGRHVCVGNAALLEEHAVKYAIPSRPGSVVHVALDDRYCGHILISDRIRNGTLEALDRLRMQGVKKLVMLTGDVLSVARPIANKLNFDMLRAELLPEDKAASVAYLTDNCPIQRAMVFVGDGITDFKALQSADIGVAINTLGRDEAIDNADIAIMDAEIRKLPLAMQIAIFCDRVILENLAAAAVIKLLIAVLGFSSALPLAAAVLLDALCSVAVIINALRTFKDWDVIKYIQKVIL